MTKPNIIFIFSDQQRPDTMGCYGQKLPVTPRLDALATGGVRFDHAITCQPVCGPARAALQTGKWATQTGCFINGISLGTDEKTMAHYMSDAGYEVGYVGKWHLASDKKDQKYETKAIPSQFRGGYNDFWIASDVLEFTSHSYDGHMFDGDGNKRIFPEGRYRVDAHTDFVLEYLQNRKTDNPFFLFISYIEPHHQNDHNCYEGPHGSKEKYKDYEVPGDLIGTEGDWRENMPDYLGCCNSLDTNVGRIIDEITRQGIIDNTIIIYTSDHGSHFCTRNAEYKRSCHESSIHIPLIIHGPGFTGGAVNEKLISLLDLTPTVLQAGGVEPPPQMVGKPLQILMENPDAEWRDAVFIQISEDHIGRSIRTKKWKYSVWVPSDTNWSGCQQPGSNIYTERYLYDLENDPFERNNLITDPQYTEVRQQLATALVNMMVDAGEVKAEILPVVF